MGPHCLAMRSGENQFLNWFFQQATGLLDLRGFESTCSAPIRKELTSYAGRLYFGGGRWIRILLDVSIITFLVEILRLYFDNRMFS